MPSEAPPDNGEESDAHPDGGSGARTAPTAPAVPTIDLSEDDRAGLDQMNRLMDTTVKLDAYRVTMAFTLGLLLIIVLLCGVLIMRFEGPVHDGDEDKDHPMGPGVIFAFIILQLLLIFHNTYRRFPRPKSVNIKRAWSMVFLITFAVPIAIFGTSKFLGFDAEGLWFLMLAVACLVTGLSVERIYHNELRLLSRPYLYLGLAMLGTSPLVVYHQSRITGVALLLLLAGVTTYVALYEAEKRVTR